MPKVRKRTSKRVGLREKYSVQKKVTAHHRKIRKEARKMQKNGVKIPFKASSKRNQIPNSFPGKEEYLNEMEARFEAEKQQKKEEIEQLRMNKDIKGQDIIMQDEIKNAKVITRPDLLSEAEKMTGLTKEEIAKAEKLIDPEGVQALQLVGVSKKGNYRELKRAIENSEVVIHVLDARDPLGTRSPEIEELVQNHGKKIIYVLTKEDILLEEGHQDIINQWAQWFKKNKLLMISLSTLKTEKEDDIERQKLAQEKLMSLLNKYAKKFQEKKEKARINVSVVGFTNVGKSSLVNFLKGKNLAATNSNPFMTKRNLEVSISAQIILVDTPAVMIMSNEDNEQVTAAQRNFSMQMIRSAIQLDELADPDLLVQQLLQKVEKNELLTYYRIADFEGDGCSVNEKEKIQKLLCSIAMKKGFTKNLQVPITDSQPGTKKKKLHLTGGMKFRTEIIPDVELAARRLIRDFLNNRLKYYSRPPI